MRIYTSRYYDPKWFEPHGADDYIMCRTTVGNIRGQLPYPVMDMRLIAPFGVFGISAKDVFEPLYVKRLNDLGVDRILRQMQRFADVTKKDSLVLLCFEDVTKPDAWCHRRMFADWWLQQTGEIVEEIYTPSRPKEKKEKAGKQGKPKTPEQPTLF